MVEPSDLEPAKLLAAYRAEAGPPLDVEARMLRSLHAQIGGPPPSGGGGAGSASAGTGASAAGGTKLIVGLGFSLATGAAVVGGLALERERSQAPPAEVRVSSVSSSATEHASTSAPELQAGPEPVVEAAVVSEGEDDTDEDLVLEPEPAPAAKRASSGRSRSKRSTNPGLADEAKLLREADEALRRGAVDAARSALDTHEQRFGDGALAGQAQVLELLLACVRDLPGAEARAAAHLQRHPKDIARARLIDQCSLDD